MAIRLVYGHPRARTIPTPQYIAAFRVRLVAQNPGRGLVLSTYRRNNGGGGVLSTYRRNNGGL